MLAAHGNIIVVTINFRLGILGFLKTGSKSSAQGNFGLMDLVAGLHWLRENLPAFGGDPERVTLMGHGTGAALANFLAVSPVSKELLKRVILFSGSGLSSWSLQREPLLVKRKVAEQTGCHGDLLEDDLAPCLRNKPLSELLSVTLDPPRFLPGFAPFVDGSVLLNPSQAGPPPGDTGRAAAVASAAGYELADFADKELLFGLTTTESYLELNAQDLEFGFNETRRDRILRTFVRNVYYYHLNEIYSTLKNEYTDWDKPVQNPLSVRDATLEVLSDGRTAAPLVRLGYLHALRGGATYFAHFQHLSSERDYPQRGGSVHGEDLPYCLGAPLVGGMPYLPYNYTQQDQRISLMVMKYIANFVRSGNPNKKATPSHQRGRPSALNNDVEGQEEALPFWDTYDTINQLYLELNSKPEMRSHYRGHKMSLWLSLIPQLHRPGSELPDFSMRHHHFQEEGASFYEGPVRPQSMQRPSLPQVKPWDAAVSTSGPPAPRAPVAPPAALAPTTDCPPNATARPPSTGADDSLLRRLASAHYQSYTAALTVTIAVGCFLLLLNVLIFAGIYHQRGSRARRADRDLGDHGSCSSSSENYDAKALNFDTRAFELESGFGYDCKAASYLVKTGSKYDLKTFPSECAIPSFGEYSCYDEKNLAAQYEKRSLADVSLCSLPDVSAAGGGGSVVRIDTQPPDIQRVRPSGDSRTSSFRETSDAGGACGTGAGGPGSAGEAEAPAGTSAPPAPAEPAPDEGGGAGASGGRTMVSVAAQADPPASILRQAAPNPPSIMKKRVQIQEISV